MSRAALSRGPLLLVTLSIPLLLSACGNPPVSTPACASWQLISIPNPGNIADQLNDIVALNSKNIWVVGSSTDTSTHNEPWTLLEHWDGASWTVVKSASDPNQYLADRSVTRIAGNSADALWTVESDHGGNALEHWDGHSWNAADTPVVPQERYVYGYASISALSPTDAWLVGSMTNRNYSAAAENVQGLTAHWDGHVWSVVPSPDLHADLNGTALSDVAELAPDDVWAVGRTSSRAHGEPALIEHWDGRTWSVVPSPQPQGTTPTTSLAALWSLSALSPNDVWTAGFYERAADGQDSYLVEHWDGSAWNLVPIPTPAKKIAVLYQILAVSDQNIWVVDADGTLFHWNGTSWRNASLPNADQNGYHVSRLAALPDGHLWLVGTVRNPTSPGPRTLIARSCS